MTQPVAACDTRTDAELVRLSRSGQRAAFGVLIDRYWKRVSFVVYQKLGNRHDAEDVAQESFIRAYRALDSLREPEKFAPWLYNIARRRAIDHLRRRGREDAVSLDALKEKYVQFAAEESEDVREKEPIDAMLEALSDMPETYRLVLLLRYFKEMSYKEIAEHLDEPLGTISNRLYRAVRKLKKRMERVQKRRVRKDELL